MTETVTLRTGDPLAAGAVWASSLPPPAPAARRGPQRLGRSARDCAATREGGWRAGRMEEDAEPARASIGWFGVGERKRERSGERGGGAKKRRGDSGERAMEGRESARRLEDGERGFGFGDFWRACGGRKGDVSHLQALDWMGPCFSFNILRLEILT